MMPNISPMTWVCQSLSEGKGTPLIR
jgi:hypothetical protein